MKIASFDVFDTVLVRVFAEPTDLFWQLGERLRVEGIAPADPGIFSQSRILAEHTARQQVPNGECNLASIYQILARWFQWNQRQTEQVLRREVELELSSLEPVPAILDRIRHARSAGQRVAFVSDMYLPPADIQTALQRAGAWQDGDTLFVSSDCGANKASGSAFALVLKHFNVAATDIEHIGDNHAADYLSARRSGISAHHFTAAHLSRYEKAMADVHAPPLSSIWAGAARIARLNRPTSIAEGSQDEVIWNTATNVIGPLLFGFVWYCLETAKSFGLKRLYFLARDGQILKQIADLLVEQWNLEIDCRYLYASRQAWHLAGLGEIDDYALDWILDPTQHLTIDHTFGRLHLTPAAFASQLAKFGFTEADWHRPLKKRDRTQLSLFFRDAEVGRRIAEHSHEYRAIAKKYFQSAGLFDSVAYALVDIGWAGRLQRSLSQFLILSGHPPASALTGIYFGLDRRAASDGNNRQLAYYKDHLLPSDKKMVIHKALFEIFVAADHGNVQSFELNEDGQAYPKLRQAENQVALSWGLKTQQEGILIFCRALLKNLESQDWDFAAVKAMGARSLKLFFTQPSRAEAMVYGDYLFFEDQAERDLYRLAPPLSVTTAVQYLWCRRMVHHNVWREATVARSNSWLKLMVSTGQSLRALAGIIRRRLHRANVNE